MGNEFMKLDLFIAVIAALCLSACATAKRGAQQTFIVRTSPPGAKVETTIIEGNGIRLSQNEYEQIKSGNIPEPDLKFKSCEPTPCSFELPRKLEFDILVSMEGYASQFVKIDHFHRKEIARQIDREVALKTVAVGTGAAVMGAGVMGMGVSAASLGTASASTGTLVAGAAVFAAPVIGVGLISYGVDASTGANYDYWPNPAAMTLVPSGKDGTDDNLSAYEAFNEARRAAIIRPYPTRKQAREEQKQYDEDRAARLASDRLFKDFATNPPPKPVRKPQSGRHERRLEKRRQREAELAKKSNK